MKNTAIIGLQWGDEGKGKIVDFLADRFDAVVRFQGGHNAGHTIRVDNKTYKLNLLPSGVVRGKFSVIGSGVVVDPIALFKEIDNISELGIKISPDNLVVADNACLILSIHRNLDQLLENHKGKNKIGTTGRGIGPAYEDKVGRRAIRICDLYDDEVLNNAVYNAVFYHNLLLRGMGISEINCDELLAEIDSFRKKILDFTKSSFEIGKQLKLCNSVMFEGAQGSLLDISYGTYPFVTSSNIIAGQVSLGSCLGLQDIGQVIGVLKAYTTRVGSGPFPTELCDEIGDFLRTEGHEYGTVTGRNRRCGWFDAALVNQAIQLSGVQEIALTKIDVLDKLEVIKICVGYEIEGRTYEYLPQAANLWSKIKPIYIEMPGWKSSIIGINSLSQLPQNAINYIKKIEELCKVKISIISTGSKREQTILMK